MRCGTYTAYNAGCRCDECRAASARYKRQRRAKAGSATGLSYRCWLCADGEWFATEQGLNAHQWRRH